MKIPLLIAFSLFTLSTFSQEYNTPPQPPPSGETNIPDVYGARYFHFGLNFTPGIYWTVPNSSNITANGAGFGYGYGANLEFYFTPNYAFLLGFEITDINAKCISDVTYPTWYTVDSSTAHSKTVQYLQLPLELKLKTSPFGHFRYYAIVGLDFGFRLKATDDYISSYSRNYGGAPVNSQNSVTVNNADIAGETDLFRVSLVIGGGVEYTIAGSTALQASITYNNCFTNLNNTNSSSAKVKGIELMLGVLF